MKKKAIGRNLNAPKKATPYRLQENSLTICKQSVHKRVLFHVKLFNDEWHDLWSILDQIFALR